MNRVVLFAIFAVIVFIIVIGGSVEAKISAFFSNGVSDWILGTENGFFKIVKNGANVFVVSSDGNVGIGVDVPMAKLDVGGNATVDDLVIRNLRSCGRVYTDDSGRVICGGGAGIGAPVVTENVAYTSDAYNPFKTSENIALGKQITYSTNLQCIGSFLNIDRVVDGDPNTYGVFDYDARCDRGVDSVCCITRTNSVELVLDLGKIVNHGVVWFKTYLSMNPNDVAFERICEDVYISLNGTSWVRAYTYCENVDGDTGLTNACLVPASCDKISKYVKGLVDGYGFRYVKIKVSVRPVFDDYDCIYCGSWEYRFYELAVFEV